MDRVRFKKEMALEEACKQVLGISSRHYRRLADAGWVPAPKGGKIDLVEAARGMMLYYQDRIIYRNKPLDPLEPKDEAGPDT